MTLEAWFPVSSDISYLVSSLSNVIHTQTGQHVKCALRSSPETLCHHVVVQHGASHHVIRYDSLKTMINLEDLHDVIIQIKLTV